MKLRTLASFLGILAVFASAASAEVRVIVKGGRGLISSTAQSSRQSCDPPSRECSRVTRVTSR